MGAVLVLLLWALLIIVVAGAVWQLGSWCLTKINAPLPAHTLWGLMVAAVVILAIISLLGGSSGLPHISVKG